jgi:hypothetical protein
MGIVDFSIPTQIRKEVETVIELWQFMSVREVRGDSEIIIQSNSQEQEWRDDYYGCPEYKEYQETWN